MSIDRERTMSDWIPIGAGAFGLVLSGQIVALVYWQDGDVTEPALSDPGFSWVPADRPWEHFHPVAVPNPGEGDWAHARAPAARAYFEWAEASWRLEPDDPSRRDEAEETAELRREAAEFLSRSQPGWDAPLRTGSLRDAPDGAHSRRSG